MKRHVALALILAISVVLITGCAAGPRKLSRTWDDHVNQKYSENAWVHGALLQDIIPVYLIVGGFAALGDVLFLNPYYFWGDDAWDNDGTAFDHKKVENAQKSVSAE
jgi:hypothetical protein